MNGRLVFDLTEPDGRLAVAYEHLGVEVISQPLEDLLAQFIAECLRGDADRSVVELIRCRLRELADQLPLQAD